MKMTKNKKRRLDQTSHAKNTNSRPQKSTKPSSQNPTTQQSERKLPQKQQRPTIPFEPEDRILLVGEGDFSFSKSIVSHHGCCDVTATCLDTQAELFEKYEPQAEEHITYLKDEGQTILYGLDATKLNATKALKGRRFERIIFNFPHVGGKSKDVNRQVRFNQELLVKFFESAKNLLVPSEGTIIVTLFEGEPYSLWNVRDLARHSGLEVVKSFRFAGEAYLGYAHSRTLGNIEGGGGWKGEDREARSFVFRLKGEAPSMSEGGKWKRKKGNEDSDDDDD